MAKSGTANGPLIEGISKGVKYFHKGNRFSSPYFVDMSSRTKECSQCHEILSFDCFYKHKNKIGRRSVCIGCVSENNKKRPKRYDTYIRYSNQLKHRYGLTVEEYKSMLEAAGGKCECCGEVSKLCVDHCHSTGKVRGLLCRNCNSALGYLKEDVSKMNSLIEYTKKHAG